MSKPIFVEVSEDEFHRILGGHRWAKSDPDDTILHNSVGPRWRYEGCYLPPKDGTGIWNLYSSRLYHRLAIRLQFNDGNSEEVEWLYFVSSTTM